MRAYPMRRAYLRGQYTQLSVWVLRSNHDTSEFLGTNLKGTAYLKFDESIDVVVNLV